MKSGCVFCSRLARGQYLKTSFPGVVALEPLNPVVPGHMLFIPRQHGNTPMLVGHAVMIAQKYGLFKQRKGIDFNIIINQGANASQTIEHLHVHYVPRTEDDGLKLPWSDQ